MNVGEFRRACRKAETKAVIISDGCRDYVVEVSHPQGKDVLADRQGRPLRFASLGQARRKFDCAHEVRLAVRIAADEACADSGDEGASFASQVLFRRRA